jgi:hypothetical protein
MPLTVDVRRAWLCGYDEYAGIDYSHRKQWVIDRLRELSNLFSIDVCSYAVMSNHYHTVLCVDQDRCMKWSEKEIVSRWTQLFALPTLVERDLNGEGTLADCDSNSSLVL